MKEHSRFSFFSAVISVKVSFSLVSALLPDHLYQNALPPHSIELTVKDLLPGPEVELAVRDRDNDLAAHDRTLEVRVGVVLAGVVSILGYRLMGRKTFEPFFEVAQEPPLVIVDEDRGRDVHGVHEHESLPHPALPHAVLDLARDIDEATARGDVEPEFFAEGFHSRRF